MCGVGFVKFYWKAHIGSVPSVSAIVKKPKPSPWNFWFLERDENDVLDAEGEDLLVVSVNISSFHVRRIFVDTSNFVGIVTTKAFYQTWLKDA